MKTEIIASVNPKFKPVSISITFETQKELDDFGTLCNLVPMVETIELPPWSKLEEIGAKISGTVALLDRILSHHICRNRLKNDKTVY